MTAARKKAYLALILCELMWGASQPLVKPALEYINPAQFLFLRYLVAAPLVIPLIVRSATQFHYSLKQIAKIVAIEAMSIFNLYLVYTALTHVTALQSSLIIQTRPIFVTIAGLFILDETIERHEWLGLLFSIAGTFTILAKPFFLHPEGLTSASFLGTSILLISNLIYTINILLIKKHYNHVSKPTISGIHMWVGLILLTPYMYLTHNLPQISVFTHPSVIIAVVYMALFGSIIALTLSNYSLTKIEASEATIFLYLQPLVYIPLSVLWLHESLELYQLLGMTLILLGVSYAASRPRHKLLRHGIPLMNRLRLLQNETPHPHMPRT